VYLISVAGSADDLDVLTTAVTVLAPRSTVGDDGQWTVVAYADAATLSTLQKTQLDVQIIVDEDTVDAQFAAALDDISETPTP
jgi:hypothetical protein